MGPQPSSSSCLRLSGKSGQYESGSRVEGGMLSEMVDPTVEKNWLKVFAISDSTFNSAHDYVKIDREWLILRG